MIRQRNGKYQVRVEYARSFATEEEARAQERLIQGFMASVEDEARAARASECPTLRELIPAFLRDARVGRGLMPDTLRDYRRRLERFARDLEDGAGDVPLDKIGRSRLLLWLERRLQEPGKQGYTVARSTAKKDLDALKTLARWAVRNKDVPPGLPLLAVTFEAEGRRDGQRAPWLGLADFVRIVHRIEDHAPHVAIVLWGMLAYGARPRALIDLKWRHISQPRGSEPGQARLPTLKKGDPATVPVPPYTLRKAVLDRCADLHEEYYPARRRPAHAVFPTRRGRSRINPRGWTPSAFANEVRRLVEALRLPEDFTAYVTRHSGVTWLKQQGVDAVAVRHWAKHRSEKTQAVYDHTSGEDARPAYEAIEDLLCKVFYRPGSAVLSTNYPVLKDIVLYED